MPENSDRLVYVRSVIRSVAGAGALLVGVLAATSAAAQPSKCLPAHSHVIRASRQAIIVATHPPEEGTVFVGCTRAKRHRYVLGYAVEGYGGGAQGGGGGILHFVLAGSIVAFEEQSISRGTESFFGQFWVRVRDLRNGRTLHLLPTGTLKEPIVGDAGVGDTA